jgi:hypothetical protein
LPQLFTVVIVGGAGIGLTAASPVPATLVHPLTVCVTEYVPLFKTVMEVLDDPVFHASEPLKLPAVSVELPQLLITATVGEAGIGRGFDVFVIGALVHPSTVWVTEYVAELVTVID